MKEIRKELLAMSILLCVLVLNSTSSIASPTVVFYEDFEDGELASNPAWELSYASLAIVEGQLHSDGTVHDDSGRYWSIANSYISVQASDYLEFSMRILMKATGNPQQGRGAILALYDFTNGTRYEIDVIHGSLGGYWRSPAFRFAYDQNQVIYPLIVSDFAPELDRFYTVRAVRNNGSWSLFVDDELIGTSNDPHSSTSFDLVHLVPVGSVVIDDIVVNVEPPNSPPTVSGGGPYHVVEGGDISLHADGSDADKDPLTYDWDLDNDGTYETAGQTVNFSAEGLDGPSSQIVGVQVADDGGLIATDETVVEIYNAPPSVAPILAPLDPVLAGNMIDVGADFADPGILDTHTAEWDWGDGTTSYGEVAETDGSGSVSGKHSYAEPGVYTLKLSVTDKDGGVGKSSHEYVVVYDPNGGFVTGGGWILSPEGAYMPDPTSSGKATFGFVTKYKKGANAPTGNTQFQFKAGGLNFHSSDYDWLVVAGAQAKFKGTGTINGTGEYGFMLTATDGQISGGSDSFRIKIWDKATDTIVYDNQPGEADDSSATTELSGGSVVIHK